MKIVNYMSERLAQTSDSASGTTSSLKRFVFDTVHSSTTLGSV